jgi:phage terminase large subunit GpA-like protein
MLASDDGLAAIERAWRDGLKPDPLLTVSAWADQHRVLSQRASSEPGRWRTARTPYLKEIMDCLSPSSPIQRVAVMKGAQVGCTEAGNCWIGYVVHQAPGPMLAVSPTVELVHGGKSTGRVLRKAASALGRREWKPALLQANAGRAKEDPRIPAGVQ